MVDGDPYWHGAVGRFGPYLLISRPTCGRILSSLTDGGSDREATSTVLNRR